MGASVSMEILGKDDLLYLIISQYLHASKHAKRPTFSEITTANLEKN